jgi:DNA-binding SARP family transcriptional activator
VRVDGRGVDLALRKGLALIAYLMEARAPVGRDHMAGLLWPDADADAWRPNPVGSATPLSPCR